MNERKEEAKERMAKKKKQQNQQAELKEQVNKNEWLVLPFISSRRHLHLAFCRSPFASRRPASLFLALIACSVTPRGTKNEFKK